MVKAVFFDMNGVIIDDEHIHELAFSETVKPYGINLTHQDYLSCCGGKTDGMGYEEIGNLFQIQLPIDKLLIEKSKKYLHLFPTHKKPYPGVLELIKELSKYYALTITSSSSRTEVDLIVKDFDISEYLKLTVSGDDVNFGKPNPEPYLKTARLLGVLPSESVVIEDSKSGVVSAKAAGCYCIGITTTHTREDLEQADLIVDTFEQINCQVINSLPS